MKLIIPPRILPLLTEVSHQLERRGVRAYLVGGFVRDALLGRETADVDIAVAADALETAPAVAAALGGKYLPLDRINRVARVITARGATPQGQWQLDFTTVKEGIEDDLARRDFTVDAMAVDLRDAATAAGLPLIDPFDGRQDLARRVIRLVSPTALADDATRLLRGIRLAAELGFTIDPETERAIRDQAHLVNTVAGERRREELLRLLALPGTGRLWPYLDGLGLLTALFPELAPARGATQPGEHHWDVLTHSLETVAATDFILRRGDWPHGGEEILDTVPWSAELAGYFGSEVGHGSTRRSLLKLAALLHDVAKPPCRTTDASGRMRFLGHAETGAATAATILERLRFSTREIKLVETSIRYHLRPGQMSHQGLPSRRAIYRYFRDNAEAGTDTLFLSLADHLATRGPDLDLAEWHRHTGLVAYVLAQRQQEASLVTPPKLVSGHDLAGIFGVRPGPRMGELLEKLRESQAAGEVTSREEALACLDRWLADPRHHATPKAAVKG